MRLPIIFCLIAFPTFIFSQNKIGVSVGMDQHVAGGGPYLGINGQHKNFRIGLNILTQINALTPYKFQQYGYFRYAQNAQESLGGGFDFGYEFKMNTSQKVRPIIYYRSGYFFTNYSRYGKDIDGSYYRFFAPQSFSTTQTIAAGVTVDLYKGLRLDFIAGSGVYIFRDSNVFTPSGENYPIDVRPDLTINLGISYMFDFRKKQ